MSTVEKVEDGDYTDEQIAKINTAKQYKDSGDQAFKTGQIKEGTHRCADRINSTLNNLNLQRCAHITL